jgi:hypothetical protein
MFKHSSIILRRLNISLFRSTLSSNRCKARSRLRSLNEEFGMLLMKTTSKTIFSFVAAGLLLSATGIQVLAQTSSPTKKPLSPKALKTLCKKNPSDSRCPAGSSTTPSTDGSSSGGSMSAPSSGGSMSAPSGGGSMGAPSGGSTDPSSGGSMGAPSGGGSMGAPSGGSSAPSSSGGSMGAPSSSGGSSAPSSSGGLK